MKQRTRVPSGYILLTTILLHNIQTVVSKLNCSKTIRDSPSISTETWYYEAVLGSDFMLTCNVCRYKHHSVTVSWFKDNIPIVQSSRVHGMHNHNKKQDEFNLRIRSMSAMDLGNYTCSLAMDNALSSPVDSVTMLVDKLPPPPEFYSKKDRVNATSQLLSWTGSSQMPIIHFLMEFRLRPLAGLGEDWVSLVIPYNAQTNVQSYLLRGLTPGTSYEARVRTKTRHGVSHYSDTWQFSTWSPWTTSKPVTVFSLPRMDQSHETSVNLQSNSWDSFSGYNNFDSQRSNQGRHNSLAKELSSFSGASEIVPKFLWSVICFIFIKIYQ